MIMNAFVSRKNSREQVEEVLAKLKPIFAEIGVFPEEIDLDSHLEEDLSVDMVNDLPKILKLINHTFSITLDLKTVRSEVTAIDELIDLIIEEISLLN